MFDHTAARALAGLTAATFGLAAVPAFAAPDATATAEALKAVLEAGEGNATVTWDAATASATDVTITNLVVLSEDGSTATFPKILIVNPVPRAEGGFTADRATFDGAVMVGADQTNVTWQSGFAENVTFPGVDELNADARIVPFSRFGISGIDASGGEMEFPFTVASVDVALANVIDGRPNDVTLAVADLSVPASAFGDEPGTAEMIAALGYETFLVDFTLDGAYDPSNDTLDVRNLAIGAADVGDLTLSGKLSSFPLGNVLQGLGGGDDEEGMALAQQALAEAKLDGARVSFTNTGIVNRMLEQQARAAGATPEQFAAGMAAALPFMLTFIGDAGLQQQLAGPLGEFIIAPNNIVVTAAPAQPVALMAIIGAGATAVGTLPGMIGLDIKANQ